MKRKGWKKFWHMLLTWSLLITVPATVVFCIWLSAVVDRYQTLGLRLDVQGGESNLLHPIMEYEWYRLRRSMGLALTNNKSDSGLRTVELFLSNGGEAQLNESLPGSGKEYVKAKIAHPGGAIEKASVRYRGDMMHHWALGKKSWRIKTKKKHLWGGIRKFNLIAPETWGILEEHFGHHLARKFALLAPVSEIVDLRVNGEGRGLHTLVGQVDELFLRSQNRMPGDLFAGDLLLADAIPGFENRVFDMPGLWTKAAINNHYADDHTDSLKRLCQVLDWAPGPEKARALGAILDMDAMGRFAAFRALVQTGHVDSYHNWKLYYDPWRNRFEPVVWDPLAWGGAWAPTPESPAFEWPLFSELDSVLAHDHRYRWAQHQALYEFFRDRKGPDLLAEMRGYVPKVLKAAEYDPALAFSILPSSPTRANQAIEILLARVQQYLDIFQARHMTEPAQVLRGELSALSPGEWTLSVTVDGWKPVAALQLEFLGNAPKELRYFWSVEGGAALGETRARANVQGALVTLSQPLLPGIRIEPFKRGHSFTHRSLPRPLTYRLRISSSNQDPLQLKQVSSVDLAGEALAIPVSESPTEAKLGDEFGALFDAAPAEPVQWSGHRTLSGLTEIHGDLHIKAGTVLSMQEGASVIVHGQVIALAGSGFPIRIGPANSDQEPWGTFAIRTSKADGSKFENVQFLGGSGYMDGLQEYSAMFSAHDVDGLQLVNCTFNQGLLVDDMVHVVYGKDLLIQDCTFENALSDALDLDDCQGRIEGCLFTDSGNDAIDLMMSQVEVADTTLLDSGDKGVSVGEGSELLWTGGRLTRCQIGIQVKDGSLAWIRDATFASNAQALNACKKNWQYGSGGYGLVEDCQFLTNRTFAEADKHSSWHFAACRIPNLPEGSQRLIQVSDFAESLPPETRRRFEQASLLKGALADR